MKATVPILFAVFVLFNLPLKVNAQQALVSAGGNAESSTGTVSYTVGQTAFYYLEGTTGSISQGVQQAYEIFLVTGTEDLPRISLDCMVYPNPVQNHLQLKITGLANENLQWHIYRLSGGLIKENRVSATLSTIPVNELISGSYLFSVLDTHNNTIKTFKIIKN